MYSIGEISKMVKLSPDTLRYYDEIQLLIPHYVNPANNYRFYSEEQVKDILYISELKDCGFGLEEIKAVLNLKNDAEIIKRLISKKAELIDQSSKIHAAVKRIEMKIKSMEEVNMGTVILIVDDAPFIRMTVKEILGKNGYKTVEAAYASIYQRMFC